MENKKIRLENKKIIFISPNFLGYNKVIKSELEKLGAVVLMFNDRPYNGLYDFFNKKINNRLTKIYQNIVWLIRLITLKINDYNTLLVIRGEDIPNFVYKKIKDEGIEMVMYQWDSVKNYNYLKNTHYFNKIITFDSLDAKNNNFKYLPLFYRREYEMINKKLTEDKVALFIGTYQPVRYKKIIELNELLKKNGISTIIKIKIPFYYFLKLKINKVNVNKKYLIFQNLSLKKVMNYYSKADIIIDIANENQSGLTMRTFEALGSRKKLLTNNKLIINESFYNSNYIKIIDEKNLFEIEDYFVNENIVKENRIDNWLLNILQ